MTFHILWDNGADACGEFPWDFATEEAATAYGENWLAEFLIDNFIEGDEDDPYERPGFDVIEVPARVDEGPPAHAIEGTFDHFDRYIGGTR